MINGDIIRFSEFLDYYKNYAKPSNEISLPKPEDEDYNENKQIPLVKSNYMMLDFDLMCKNANFYPKRNMGECNRPATVDAIYYRILDENKLELTLVEFKNFYYDWDSKGDYIASLKKN